MYKISEFSILSKTTIKTLRYYEKENLLKPSFVDTNNYRYYETKQLTDLGRIISLRQVGFSINEIKQILDGCNLNELLKQRRINLEKELSNCQYQLSKIKFLLEEKNMKYEVIVKELPDYVVYYKEGIIEDFSKITDFILSSGQECKLTNPNIRCIEPDYCYINYLDGEYKEKNINIRYCQAVEKEGIPNETIKFRKLDPVEAVCIYHKGSYENIGDAYGFIMKYIEDNNYEMIESPRERYIDGIWNKENQEDWLTEIQAPVKKEK